MKIRLGIREKASLLVVILVGATAAILLGTLFERSRDVVTEHELLDLVNDSEIRAWPLVDQVSRLREDALGLATDSRFRDLLEAGNAAAMRERAKEICNLRSQWPNYLRVEVIDGAGVSTEIEPGNTIASRPSAEQLRAWSDAEAHGVFLSPLRQTEVTDRATGQSVARYVIWAAVPMGDEEWLLIAANLDEAIANIRLSPRHLAFVVDEGSGGEAPYLLLHPDQAISGKPLDAGGQAALEQFFQKPKSDEQIAFAAQMEAYLSQGRDSSTTPSGGLRAQVERLGTETLRKQPLSQFYLFREAKLNKLPVNGNIFRREVARHLLPRYDAEGKRIRAEPELNLLRVLATEASTDQQSFEDFTARVEQDLRALFDPAKMKGVDWSGVTLDWGEPVVCKTCDVAFVRIKLVGAGGVQNLLFAHALFDEELASNVNDGLATVRWAGLILTLLAGTLAFAAALWFVRPLQRITRTANSVAVSDLNPDPTDDELVEKVERLRETLPVARCDEVGEIGRALDRLLAQVSAGHQALRDWSRTLEERVRERTRELEQTNEKLGLANAALEAQAQRLADANDQLQGLSRDKDQFLATVSHELRTPLNALFGFLQFLEMSDLDEEQQADMQKIRQAGSTLLDLINDILDYQKIVMGGLTLEPEPVDTPQFLNDLHQSMQFAAQTNNNRLSVRCEGVSTIEADPHRLRQVLVNLVSNACKFTRNGDVILEARLADDPQFIQFTVTDTGRGMTPEEQKKLFRRFVKLANKEGNKGGTGLGLVICKGLCDLMGGGIEVESVYGKGSKFTVRVPVHQEAQRQTDSEWRRKVAAAAATRHQPSDDAPVDHTGRTVLVIDDDPAARELMERRLAREGFQVVTACDGIEGIELAERIQPDVITLDAIMPGLDGWAVLAALKTDTKTASTPVVMITMLDDQGRGFALGADDYLVKPVDWEQLSRTLNAYTGPQRARHVLVVDDEEPAREIVRRYLTMHGWTVTEAADGAEAVARLEETLPAAIILDLMMPVMDGFEFLDEYNRRPEWQGIPVLVVTAKSPTVEERARLEKSVARIMQKGRHTYEELLHEIRRRVVERRRPPPATSAPLETPSSPAAEPEPNTPAEEAASAPSVASS